MGTLQAEQALFLRDALLPWVEVEHRVTIRVLGAVPDAKGDYRPDEVTKSAVDLAWHFASSEIRFLRGVASGVFDYEGPAREEGLTPSGLAAWYEVEFAKSFRQIAQMSGAELAEIADYRGFFQLPRVAYLQLGVNHTIHHRGQLSMYLRPMGAKVPSIYGDSHDSASARRSG